MSSSDPSCQLLCERVLALRQEHNYTLDQLATASGVSRSMLSQIERGNANPTLAVTRRIAQAFGLSIGDLVDDPAATTPIDIVHGEDAANLFRADEECQIRTLSPLHMEKSVEFYELLLHKGAQLSSAAHFDGTRELFTVASGSARVISGDTDSSLNSGDSAHYRADTAHAIINSGDSELRGYLVVMYK